MSAGANTRSSLLPSSLVSDLARAGLALGAVSGAGLLFSNARGIGLNAKALDWSLWSVCVGIQVVCLSQAFRFSPGPNLPAVRPSNRLDLALAILFAGLAAAALSGHLCTRISAGDGLAIAILSSLVLVAGAALLLARGETRSDALTYSLATLVSWICVVQSLWWLAPANISGFLAGTLGFCAAYFWIIPASARAPRRFRRLDIVLIACALVLFGVEGFRVDRVEKLVAFMHWGAFVGPIELVGEGGTLLWDTFSLYGFLSILFPAFLRTVASGLSGWEAFWVAFSLAKIGAAALFFTCLRARLGNGRALGAPLATLCAFLVTFVTLFFVSGMAKGFLGPNTFPSTGAYRFFPVWVLWFLIAKSDCRDSFGRSVSIWTALAWSLLWSFETGACALASWGLWTIAKAAVRTTGKLKDFARDCARLFGLLFVMTALLSLVYQARIGHVPDWNMYAESVSGFVGGFGQIEMDRFGAAQCLLLGWLLTLAPAFALARERQPDFPAWVGVSGGFLAAVSYFVNRSADNNVTNLLPSLLLCVTLCHGLARPTSGRARTTDVLFASLVAGLIALPLFDLPSTLHFVRDKMFAPKFASAFQSYPAMTPKIEKLLARAGVTPATSFNWFLDDNLPPHAATGEFFERPWLAVPQESFRLLKPERASEISLRRLARDSTLGKSPGWTLSFRKVGANTSPFGLPICAAQEFHDNDFSLVKWRHKEAGETRCPPLAEDAHPP